MSELLRLDAVSKVFRKRGPGIHKAFTALDSVSLSIARGSIFGLVGESGCGKTTLTRALLFLDPPSSGRVIFDSRDLGSLSRKDLRLMRKRMQVVFQDPNGALNPRATIETSLSEGLSNLGVPRRERRKRIERVLDQVGIPRAKLASYPYEFSGGQRQRLVIARSLTMEPDLLVLDEPVSSLDVSVQAQIINLLLELKRELDLTYLFVSHDLDLVAYLSDTIAVMKEGRIVETGSTEKILANPENPYTRELFLARSGGDDKNLGVDS